MNEGYLIARCSRCNSISRLSISGIRGEYSLCPVCLEGTIELQAIRPGVTAKRKLTDRFRTLELFASDTNQLEMN